MANENILQEFNEFSYEVQELNEDGMPKKFRLKGISKKLILLMEINVFTHVEYWKVQFDLPLKWLQKVECLVS